jgi:CDP-paratose 2-epimerase
MKRRIFVTGGAGFIGSNVAAGLLRDGYDVTIFDALLRRGAEHNLAWLRDQGHDGRLHFVQGDVRDFETLRAAASGADRGPET